MSRRELVKNQSYKQELFRREITNLLSNFSSTVELESFLSDLLTPKEYNELSLRWQIVKLLCKGLSIREVSDRLGVAVATISRGARELKYSKSGGFKKVLSKIKV